jgi:hypothetical protein
MRAAHVRHVAGQGRSSGWRWAWTALLLMAAANGSPARADLLDIRGQLVRPDGSPLAQHPLRLVVGTETEPRAPQAGLRLVTDAQGRFRRQLETKVPRRFKTLDIGFIPHRTDLIEIGVELELLGRPALYWIELDHLRDGVLGGMGVFLKDGSGRFRERPKFHSQTHSWSFPDDPNGMQLSDIGANLRAHDARLTTAADGKRHWVVELKIEKGEFTLR